MDHKSNTADLIERAHALIPELGQRAAEAETLRRLPEANVAALKRAGLLKVLQARRYGGHQASLHAHVDTVATIACGCGSTAWWTSPPPTACSK